MSGSPFLVSAHSPKAELSWGVVYFCCPPCEDYFVEHKEKVLAKRGVAA